MIFWLSAFFVLSLEAQAGCSDSLTPSPEGTAIHQALSVNPRPLIMPEHRIIFSFSAKCGCTFAVKWAFAQMGLLEKALRHDPWIHKFRTQVYYHGAGYQSALADVAQHWQQYRVIKVARSPFERAVSSYLQANKTGYADHEIASYLDRAVTEDKRFSFREFVSYLGSIDLRRTDVHQRLQLHPIDRLAWKNGMPYLLVPLERAEQFLEVLAEEFSLKSVDFASLRTSFHHSARLEDKKFVGDVPFAIYRQRSPQVPVTESFYDPDLASRVGELYRDDFRAFGYEGLAPPDRS